MVRLIDINESNFFEASRLSVKEEQKRFLDSPLGIIARGYVYRECNARVFAVENDGVITGLVFIRNLDEEPACYDLQQFMIDSRFQGRGFAKEALNKALCLLENEGCYPCVEVCVNKENTAALALFENAGFKDTGFVDENLPDCLNLRYTFKK